VKVAKKRAKPKPHLETKGFRSMVTTVSLEWMVVKKIGRWNNSECAFVSVGGGSSLDGRQVWLLYIERIPAVSTVKM
jgi:hypothetical protein